MLSSSWKYGKIQFGCWDIFSRFSTVLFDLFIVIRNIKTSLSRRKAKIHWPEKCVGWWSNVSGCQILKPLSRKCCYGPHDKFFTDTSWVFSEVWKKSAGQSLEQRPHSFVVRRYDSYHIVPGEYEDKLSASPSACDASRFCVVDHGVMLPEKEAVWVCVWGSA